MFTLIPIQYIIQMEENVKLIIEELVPANNTYKFNIKLRKKYPRGHTNHGVFFNIKRKIKIPP